MNTIKVFLFMLVVLFVTDSSALVPDSSQPQLQQLPEQWAKGLDQLQHEPFKLQQVFNEQLITLASVRFSYSNFKELNHWYNERRTRLLSSKHKIKNIQQINLDDGKTRLIFEYVIEEQGIDEPIHIFRLKEDWLIDVSQNGQPRVVEMTESYLSPVNNSGAQIQC